MTRFAFLDLPRPHAIAHRGGAAEAEENSLAAFEHAAALGYRYLETDIQASADDVPVVIHDAQLERTTDAAGPVSARTWAELQAVRTRGGQRLLRLEELFEALPEMRIALELKSPAAAGPAAEAIRRCGALERVSVGSFDQRATDRARRLLGPGLCWSPGRWGVLRTWLRGFGLPLPLPGGGLLQVPPYRGRLPLVTPRFLRAARRGGLSVQVWTVNEEAEMIRLLDLGVDGLMTDRPSLLKALLQARGLW